MAFRGSAPASAADWAALGYRCKTRTCEGHNKGWAWGEEWGIEDEGYAEGNSESFNEGVQAYARFMNAALAGVDEGTGEVSGGGAVGRTYYRDVRGRFTRAPGG